MNQELYELYKRNFPFVVRDKATVMRILSNEGNTVIERRDGQNKLIGASVVNENTILLLCVDAEHRNKGVGTGLLNESEQIIADHGYGKVTVGAGFDYIMPGVPTSRNRYKAENVNLYPEVDRTAENFFAGRGYVHKWDCDCFDMRFPLSQFSRDKLDVGATIEGITYRWAVPADLEGICACTQDAFPEFTEYYRDERLYGDSHDARVLIAVSGEEVVGTLIVGVESKEERLGSVGCTTVRHSCRGKHVAVNLVTIGTGCLKDAGMREAYLSYTYTGLDHLYGYAGYKVCVYFMMAEKEIN
ncbi:MAG: hypothetical protein K2K63_01155 [Acetatifactor sp.]|nr:hypothetical protein [Acetatifactor sp.]